MNTRIFPFCLSFLLSLCLPALLQAQQVTIEYAAGYGIYKMEDMKGLFKSSISSIPIRNIRVTDLFPGYITHHVKAGVTWKALHHAGLSVDYMNTAAHAAVSDYSASYASTLRMKGVRLGAFYRFALPHTAKNLLSPYLQLSTGAVFNNGKATESLTFTDSKEDSSSSSESLEGVNFFVEPAFGIKIRVLPILSLHLNAGYEFDLTQQFRYQGQSAIIGPDWSGLRVQAGVMVCLF
ncbi:MAG: hypothetical protein LBQ78_06130 [Tannerellaceae bacterium]|jgi:hypothetical protein|nr:hypothetical protein [Tannerellaceae bacterium]